MPLPPLRPCSAVPYLNVSQQRGLRSWQPSSQEQHDQQSEHQQTDREQRGAAAAAAGGATPATYEELLAQLPGLQRVMRDTAQERSGLVRAPERDPWTPDQPFRYPQPEEPELSEWDLRAKMEKKRRQQRAREGEEAGVSSGLAGALRARRGWPRVCRLPCRLPQLATAWGPDYRLLGHGGCVCTQSRSCLGAPPWRPPCWF